MFPCLNSVARAFSSGNSKLTFLSSNLRCAEKARPRFEISAPRRSVPPPMFLRLLFRDVAAEIILLM